MADKTKAQRVHEEVEALIASGVEKRAAFQQLSEKYGQPIDSIRGSFYGWKRKLEGGGATPSRTRRRETTPDDALADARASLERSIASIDREVEVAKERAEAAAGEFDEIRGSADARKKAIAARLDALK
ncbi:MAG TPA: hypothetical protein VID48_11005 [Solirubrobacteraceae bacterium]|jgi:hypothetical protein